MIILRNLGRSAVTSLHMAVDLQQLSQVLEASLDPSKNKQGMLLRICGKPRTYANLCTSGVGYTAGGEEGELLHLLAPDSRLGCV